MAFQRSRRSCWKTNGPKEHGSALVASPGCLTDFTTERLASRSIPGALRRPNRRMVRSRCCSRQFDLGPFVDTPRAKVVAPWSAWTSYGRLYAQW